MLAHADGPTASRRRDQEFLEHSFEKVFAKDGIRSLDPCIPREAYDTLGKCNKSKSLAFIKDGTPWN
jgi:hypothetical protein